MSKYRLVWKINFQWKFYKKLKIIYDIFFITTFKCFCVFSIFSNRYFEKAQIFFLQLYIKIKKSKFKTKLILSQIFIYKNLYLKLEINLNFN